MSLAPDPKAELIARVLALRPERQDLVFGDYTAIEAGPNVSAFLRGPDILVVVPLRNDWEHARLEGVEGRWRDVLRGGEIRLDGSAWANEAVQAPAGALLARA